MIIMKFGGTSLGKPERIRGVLEIVKARLDREPVVVVSAFAGITNLIIEKLNLAALEGVADLEHVAALHRDTAGELGVPGDIIEPEIEELDKILSGVALLRESTPRVNAMAHSLGERMSAKIVAAFFTKSGLAASALNAADCGLLADGGFANARHLPECEGEFAKNIRAAEGIPVITGFIARNRDGLTVTLGRSGSDYSASIAGSALDAEEIQIWTDVDGVMTADPSVATAARNIPVMSFDEASEVAYFGARVIHPGTMLPAMEKGIPVRIVNTFKPELDGTLVVSRRREEGAKRAVRSLVYKENIIVVTVVTADMFQRSGYIEKIGGVMARHGISTDITSTGEISISMTTDSGINLSNAVEELSKFSRVTVETDMTIMGVVGDGIGEDGSIAAKIFGVLAGEDIHPAMISQAATRMNVSFVIKNTEIKKAVTALHREFFERA